MDEGRAGLVTALAESGLIQFGRFTQADGSVAPVALHLDWLPSYPAVLRQVAVALHGLSQGLTVERVLAAPEALPVAVALALQSDLPVTYSHSAAHDAGSAFAIVGAYDVGHPTLLLANVLDSARTVHDFIVAGAKVGLEVTTVLAVIDLGGGASGALQADGVEVRCALTLPAILAALEARGELPGRMCRAVEAWLRQLPHT